MFYQAVIPEEIVILNGEFLPDYYFEELLSVWVYPRRTRFKLVQTYSMSEVINKSIQMINSIVVEV